MLPIQKIIWICYCCKKVYLTKEAAGCCCSVDKDNGYSIVDVAFPIYDLNETWPVHKKIPETEKH